MNRLDGRRALAAAAHTALSAVLCWLYLGLFVVAAPLALLLITVVVGIPIMLGLLAVVRLGAEGERRLANALLGTSIQPPVPLADLGRGNWQQLMALVRSISTWRSVLFLLIRMVLGFGAMLGLLLGGGTTVALLITPFVDGAVSIGDWTTARGWSALWALPLAVVAAGITVGGAAALGWVSGRLAELLLGPAESERVRILERTAADLEARQLMARELHDLVGHAMSTVVVQAAAARRVGDDDAAFTTRALADIEDVARRSLEELDDMLTVLRDGDEADLASIGGNGPTLADLDALLGAVRSVGVPLQVRTVGEIRLLDREVSATAYRIVQEALTNVIRHAGAAATTVDLVVEPPRLTIDVVNDEPVAGLRRVARPGRRGRGLQGVRERATRLGGRVDTGPDGGGYRLRAVLPVATDTVGAPG